MFKLILSLFIVVIAVGCTTVPSENPEEVDENKITGQEADEEEGYVTTPVDESVPAAKVDLKDDESDIAEIPHEFNKSVQKWIDYFTGRGRPHMERYLSRSTRYMPKMKEILKNEGLPTDLVYIALIESGFNSQAHSHANAVGYWQFIRGTAKRYGMRVDGIIDERRDFILSTKAAAQYYKALHSLFGSWYLAIAAYNVGENKVKRAVMRNYSRDFWVIAKKRGFPRETIDYVPKFLAARMIAKHPENYGFKEIEYQTPLDFDEVEVNTSVDLKKWASLIPANEEELLGLNPAYRRGVVPYEGNKITLRLPKGLSAQALAVVEQTKVDDSYVVKIQENEYFWYRVRRGDTLSGIARKFGTRMHTLRDINNFGRGARIVAGRKIKVPETYKSLKILKKEAGANNKDKNGAQAFDSKSSKKKPESKRSLAKIETNKKIPNKKSLTDKVKSKSNFNVYRVKPGDTLSAVANKFGTQIAKIKKINGFGKRSKLYAGEYIKVPHI